ncbi:hypothetical protein [Candidatus Protochlamydia phocaeensis]|uniref:hypothetical protein n=1 Tax=Candidatus Protochlamydia phocaeensis TaxID=1414722 RepID=UPI000838C3BC|nr:hypothetical protein [Candidatus Protochlamydia phocaeensis]
MIHSACYTKITYSNSLPNKENIQPLTNPSSSATTNPPCGKPPSLNQINVLPERLLCLLNSHSVDWMPIYAELFSLTSFMPEHFAFIFEHEADIRQAIAEAEKAPWISEQMLSEAKALHKKILLPLLAKAKAFLINQKAHLTIHTAAQMGRALHAGIKAVTKLIKEGHAIETAGNSNQEVFILPEEKVVFKLLNERARG